MVAVLASTRFQWFSQMLFGFAVIVSVVLDGFIDASWFHVLAVIVSALAIVGLLSGFAARRSQRTTIRRGRP
jgi:hypothetical protein